MLNFRLEKRLFKRSGKIIAGMDEVGRGPIAGPIAVGAVIVDLNFYRKIKRQDKWWRLVNDSKKLSPKLREEIFVFIKRYLPFGVGMASPAIIDNYGIKKAIKVAAKRALRKLPVKPEIILLDGNRKFLHLKNCSERTVVKGDGKIWSIACASIAAKVVRDNYMVKAGKRFSRYHFPRHKGYGTALHVKCLEKYGPCPLHRFSFQPVKSLGFQKPFSRVSHESGSN